MKYVWQAILGLVVLALILAGLHLWPDEDLDPDLVRWRAHRPGGAVTAQNFHYGLFGLTAPVDQDPFIVGRNMVERYITFGEYPSDDFERGLQVSGELQALCAPGRTDCNLSVDQAIPLLADMESQHSELLTRYLMLHEVQDIRYPMELSWSSPIPSYSRLFQLQRLVMLRIIERTRSGDAAAVAWAWRALASQLAAHRRFLANAEILIDKIVMAGMVQTDLATYAVLIEDAAGGGEMPPMLPRPLTDAERSMMVPFRNEAILIEYSDEDAFWKALVENQGEQGLQVFMARLVPFNYNATVNALADQSRRSAELSTLPPAEFLARVDELGYDEPSVWDWMVNTIGAIAASVAAPDFANLIYRVDDIDAQVVLLRVMARARNEGVSEADMGGFLESLGPALRNPYDGTPAVYADGMLSFPTDRDTGGAPLAFAFTPGS
jgi:hypothetical protein